MLKIRSAERRASSRVPFVYVRTPEYEKPTGTPTNPRQELRKEVRNHHSQARLDILQREVLRVASAVHTEARSHARHDLEERPERRHDAVYVHVRVVAELPIKIKSTAQKRGGDKEGRRTSQWPRLAPSRVRASPRSNFRYPYNTCA